MEFDKLINRSSCYCEFIDKSDFINIDSKTEFYKITKKYYLHDICVLCVNSCKLAGLNGHLECLKLAHRQKYSSLNQYVSYNVAKSGNLECLKYIIENGCKWDDVATRKTIQKGNIYCVRYLHEKKMLNLDACSYVLDIKCLKFLYKNNYPIVNECFENMIKKNKAECLKYLLRKKNIVNKNNLLKKCIDYDQLDCFKVLYSLIINENTDKTEINNIINYVCEKNTINILKFIDSLGLLDKLKRDKLLIINNINVRFLSKECFLFMQKYINMEIRNLDCLNLYLHTINSNCIEWFDLLYNFGYPLSDEIFVYVLDNKIYNMFLYMLNKIYKIDKYFPAEGCYYNFIAKINLDKYKKYIYRILDAFEMYENIDEINYNFIKIKFINCGFIQEI
jgi:hypothetical protein